ncbi:acyl-CoA reductase [Streptomyces sp. TLI_146]|uniref:acyl-CoA reductase n=1 Tax=Streptomyces sp. TLI_146 TaxID=1938858 RepID=UPI000CA96D81|nr:acyl-CoA reductase [Streptomyces sp. TLI_146]PKV83021.1 phenylacetate-coenzyme A ligase PaaK-like adenylate-forming protein [Streptomyces sp. TLI_146]
MNGMSHVNDIAHDHLWQGTWIGDAEADKRLGDLSALVADELSRSLSARQVIAACDRLSTVLTTPDHPTYAALAGHLVAAGQDRASAEQSLAEIADFLRRDGLEKKVVAELGGTAPQSLARADFRTPVFESWQPVGLLTHVTASNDPIVGIFSAVEGLLAGNVNVVKVSGGDSLFTHHLLHALGALDPDGRIPDRLIVLRFPSSRTDWLRRICAPADAVAAWGGEAATAGVAAQVPAGCRLITFGHKISFAYVTSELWSDRQTLDGLADSVCRLDQQACSSPQVVYLDTADREELSAFAHRLGEALDRRGGASAGPAVHEQAEITTTVLVAKTEEHLGLTRVHESPTGAWRILVDHRSALRASPLYRTVWVKPLPRERIVATLRPMRRFLQTAGLAATRGDVPGLAAQLFTAGALRVTPIGSMLDSYAGEPHDGLYPLQRYSRRVSVRLDERFTHDTCLDDLRPPADTEPVPPLWQRPDPARPVLGKAEVQALNTSVSPEKAQLHLASGGSSGTPAVSLYTYADFRTQTRRAGEGLVAAGLDVRTDRVANLLYSGDMYASFLYGHGLLEAIDAVQLPICAGSDYERDARLIVRHRANTLLAMPSYIWQLFRHAGDVLAEYGGVKKIFYGGEHFSAEQRAHLKERFGIELIRSFVYGGTDLGTMGHQCPHAEGSVHHLFSDLFTLEILEVDSDRPVAEGGIGRLVFTPHTRSAPAITRYEQGDLGRWVEGACGCGRTTPRFELLGRTGDVVRAGTYFINYRRIARIVAEHLGYCGELQMVVETAPSRERITVRMEEHGAVDPTTVVATLLAHYPELHEAVTTERLLDLSVEAVGSGAFERSAASGKLRTVVDRRLPA